MKDVLNFIKAVLYLPIGIYRKTFSNYYKDNI